MSLISSDRNESDLIFNMFIGKVLVKTLTIFDITLT